MGKLYENGIRLGNQTFAPRTITPGHLPPIYVMGPILCARNRPDGHVREGECPGWFANQRRVNVRCAIVRGSNCPGVKCPTFFRLESDYLLILIIDLGTFLARHSIYRVVQKKRYPSFNFAITSVNVHRL